MNLYSSLTKEEKKEALKRHRAWFQEWHSLNEIDNYWESNGCQCLIFEPGGSLREAWGLKEFMHISKAGKGRLIKADRPNFETDISEIWEFTEVLDGDRKRNAEHKEALAWYQSGKRGSFIKEDDHEDLERSVQNVPKRLKKCAEKKSRSHIPRAQSF